MCPRSLQLSGFRVTLILYDLSEPPLCAYTTSSARNFSLIDGTVCARVAVRVRGRAVAGRAVRYRDAHLL